MVFNKQIKKIGNSLAIIIPSGEVKFNKYKEHEWVEVRLRRVK